VNVVASAPATFAVRRGVRAAGSLGLLVVLTACFGEPDESSDTGASATGSSTAGDDTQTGDPQGSSSEGTTSGADDTSTSGGPPVSWCEEQMAAGDVLVCADFDGEDPLADWSTTEINGTVTLEEGDASSPPGFLRSRIMGGDGGGATAVSGVVVSAPSPVSLTLDAQVRQSEGCGVGPMTRVFGIAFYDSGTLVYSLLVSTSAAGSRMDEISDLDPVGHMLPAVVAFEDTDWHEVRLEFNAAAATASLSVGGVAVGTPVALEVAGVIVPDIAPLVTFGQQRGINTDTPCSVDFDSVLVAPGN
jgi:hypothetical protein